MGRGQGAAPRLYDVTLTLGPGLPTFPGEPGAELVPVKRIARGDPANVSSLSVGLHTGTHVDAPVHFLEAGADATALPLEALCGPARVVAIRSPVAVTVVELAQLPLEGVRRVLFKTRNGALWGEGTFRRDFVHLAPEAARWLVERGVLLVGLDYLSIEAFGARPARAHETLLRQGVVVVEGLDLREPPAGDYELWCLPLKVAGGDGAPARVVLAPPGGRAG